jgi:DNA-binding transcriptional LysR family regulator
MRGLFNDHRRVTVNMIIGSRAQLVPALRRGELDLLVADLDAGPPSELVEEPLFIDRNVIVVRDGHPLAGSRRVDMSQLVDYRWIASTESSNLTDELLARALEFGPPKINDMVRSNSSLFIKLLLAETDAIGVIAHNAVAADLHTKTFVELRLTKVDRRTAAALAPRRIGFVYRSPAALSTASRALMKDIRRICRERGAA